MKWGDGVILKALCDGGGIDQVVRLKNDQPGDEISLFVDLTVDQVQLRSLPEGHLSGGLAVAKFRQVEADHQLRAGGALSHTAQLSLVFVDLQQVYPKGVGGDSCNLLLCAGRLFLTGSALL